MRLSMCFPSCIFYWMVASCWCIVVLGTLIADAEKKTSTLAFSSALLSPSTRRVAFFKGQQLEEAPESERQLQGQEKAIQRHTTSGSFGEQAVMSSESPLSSDQESTSDASCVPGNMNIGSTTKELTPPQRMADVESCQEECHQRPECTHFTYNTKSKYCYVKGGVPKPRSYPDDLIGPRSCSMRCQPGCVFYNGTPLQTLDYEDSPDYVCWSACLGTPNCVMALSEGGKCKLYDKIPPKGS